MLSIRRPTFGFRYADVEPMATGGMAEVYRARLKFKRGLSKPVILKKIRTPYEKDPTWVQSFWQEAKIMAMLSHSNIVQVYDFGKSRSGYFFSMEWIDGGSLLDLTQGLKRDAEPMPDRFVFYVALEILKGLSYAHQRGVVHQDLSPSNILISVSGEVKIADFGVARFLSDSLKATPFVEGKRRYMSPEQRERKPVGPASDLYSLSVILSELFGTNYAFLKRGRCIDPQERFQTCEEMERAVYDEMKTSEGPVTGAPVTSGLVTSGLVTQREFSHYLSRCRFGVSHKTVPLSEMTAVHMHERKGGYLKVAVVILLLCVLGRQVPHFY